MEEDGGRWYRYYDRRREQKWSSMFGISMGCLKASLIVCLVRTSMRLLIEWKRTSCECLMRMRLSLIPEIIEVSANASLFPSSPLIAELSPVRSTLLVYNVTLG